MNREDLELDDWLPPTQGELDRERQREEAEAEEEQRAEDAILDRDENETGADRCPPRE